MKQLPVLLLVALSVTACKKRCPLPDAQPSAQAAWERWMERKEVLALDASSSISIKRDVHELVVNLDAATFATAFHEVMQDPARRFGLIQVNRFRSRHGRPFQVGERFQGRFGISDAIRTKWQRLYGSWLEDEDIRQIICQIENKRTSDYGELFLLELEMRPGLPYEFGYRYLSGSPIAGSSVFQVRDIEPGPDGQPRSGVKQIFTYQEQSRAFARFFSKMGLKLHNQVVYQQVLQSAEHGGGTIVESTIPSEYIDL